jgi:hypothetical protein
MRGRPPDANTVLPALDLQLRYAALIDNLDKFFDFVDSHYDAKRSLILSG